MGQVTDAQGRNAFQESFLNHLQRMRLRLQVNIAAEGTLLLPGEMGERFKVLALTRGISDPLPGFSFRDLAASL